MAAREETHEDPVEEGVLADDPLGQFVSHLGHEAPGLPDRGLLGLEILPRDPLGRPGFSVHASSRCRSGGRSASRPIFTPEPPRSKPSPPPV